MPLPSFQIDAAQLRELRIAKRWTAENAATELRCRLGKVVDSSNAKQAHSATVAYQRLERTGKTSLKTAQALADIFEVPMETLQGKEPIDAVKHLRTILARRLEEPAAQGLKNAYGEYKRNSYVIGEASVDDVALGGLAEDVAERIERVQLSRDPDEFEVLSKLLGVEIDELKKPIVVRGHWWVTTSGDTKNDAYVISGIRHLLGDIKAFVENAPPLSCEQRCTIRLTRRGVRYRLDVATAGVPDPRRIEWWRCEPEGDVGLRWVPPSRWEGGYLDRELTELAFCQADQVVGFDGKALPQNPRTSFLCITVEDWIAGMGWRAADPIRVRSDIDDYPDRYLERKEASGQLDWWLQAQLKVALEDVLRPHLAAWVAELWEVPDLPEPRLVLHHFARSPSRRHTQEAARRYRMELMTIDSKGEETRAPWRKAHVDELKKTIRRWIDAAKADCPAVDVGTSASETPKS